MKATWNQIIIAESDNTVSFQGEIYFPKASLRKEYFRISPDNKYCPLKGDLKSFDIILDGEMLANAAWSPVEKRDNIPSSIIGLIAFSKPVQVT